MDSERWQQDAACREPENAKLFFPPSGDNKERIGERRVREDQAKAVCRTCVVREPCLEYGLRNKEDGIYGGMNNDERKHLLEMPTRPASPDTTPS